MCALGACGPDAPAVRAPAEPHTAEPHTAATPAPTDGASAPAAGAAAGDPPLSGPLVIDVTGHDYNWMLRYPGEDGVQGTDDDVHAVRHLHLPEGVRTVVRLHSDDFLYIFRLPHLELSEIAVPDLEFSLEFDSGPPGRHELRGDQMCGFAHASLLGLLIVEPQPDRAAGKPDPEVERANAEDAEAESGGVRVVR